MTQARGEHPGDSERLRVVLAAFDEMLRDDVFPVVALAEGRVSSAGRQRLRPMRTTRRHPRG